MMFTFKLTPGQKKQLQTEFDAVVKNYETFPDKRGAIVGLVQCWESGKVEGKFISNDIAVAVKILMDMEK